MNLYQAYVVSSTKQSYSGVLAFEITTALSFFEHCIALPSLALVWLSIGCKRFVRRTFRQISYNQTSARLGSAMQCSKNDKATPPPSHSYLHAISSFSAVVQLYIRCSQLNTSLTQYTISLPSQWKPTLVPFWMPCNWRCTSHICSLPSIPCLPQLCHDITHFRHKHLIRCLIVGPHQPTVYPGPSTDTLPWYWHLAFQTIILLPWPRGHRVVMCRLRLGLEAPALAWLWAARAW